VDSASTTVFSVSDQGTTTLTNLSVTDATATSTIAGGLDVLAINQTGSATSTFAQGIDVAAGCFAIGGVCLSAAGLGGVTTLDGLTDVDTSGVTFGNVITYDGVNWVDTATSTLKIALSDTTGTLAVNRGGTGVTTLDDVLGTANEITVTSGANTIIGGDLTLSIPALFNIQQASTTQFSAGIATFGETASSTFGANGLLTLTTNGLSLNGSTVTDFVGDATISLSSGNLRVVDVTCTDCLNATEIEDIYLVNNADDTTSGVLTASSYLSTGSGTSTLTNLWTAFLQAGTLIETPYFNATSTSASSTIAHGLNVGAINQTGSATSTFAQGIQIAAGCFQDSTGNCIPSGNATAISDLTDVTITTAIFGDQLQYNGSAWVNIATSTLKIALSDTTGTLAVNRGGTGVTTLDDVLGTEPV